MEWTANHRTRFVPVAVIPFPDVRPAHMDFYHFTYPKHLRKILKHGLKPATGKASNCEHMLGGHKAVWLKQEPTLVPSRQLRECLLRRGILLGPHASFLPNATVCLKVDLDEDDNKLSRHVDWLRQQGEEWDSKPDPDDALADLMDDWIYLGAIPPRRLSVFKHVAVMMAFHEVPIIREAFLEGHPIEISKQHLDDLLDAKAGPPSYIEQHKEFEKRLRSIDSISESKEANL